MLDKYHWVSKGCLFTCTNSSVPLVTSSVCPQQPVSLFINGKFSLFTLSDTAPRMFTKLLGPVAAHLHLWGCLMYPYTDNIFHVRVSFHQVSHIGDISLCCHFKVGLCDIHVNLSRLFSQSGTWCSIWEHWSRRPKGLFVLNPSLAANDCSRARVQKLSSQTQDSSGIGACYRHSAMTALKSKVFIVLFTMFTTCTHLRLFWIAWGVGWGPDSHKCRNF